MNDEQQYAAGGYTDGGFVPSGASGLVILHPDECLLTVDLDGRVVCRRPDHPTDASACRGRP